MSQFDVDMIWAERHDTFNLITLPICVISNILYIYNMDDPGWTHDAQFWTFLIYIVVDLLFIFAKPRCVGSPNFIMVHHVVSTVTWFTQLVDPMYVYLTSLALLVEINTVLKIAKRYWDNVIMDVFFYMTWFALRCVMYPILFWMSLMHYLERSKELETYIHVGAFVCGSCLILTFMNYKWTYDMLMRLMTSKKNKNGSENGGRRNISYVYANQNVGALQGYNLNKLERLDLRVLKEKCETYGVPFTSKDSRVRLAKKLIKFKETYSSDKKSGNCNAEGSISEATSAKDKFL
jgi:hypothetical protein